MKTDKWANAKSKTLEGKQVKCLIASEGHMWMKGYYDRMSPRVRSRLANSPFNICPACLNGQVNANSLLSRKSRATDADYFRCIEAVEQELKEGNR
jgi:hypothetical protein